MYFDKFIELDACGRPLFCKSGHIILASFSLLTKILDFDYNDWLSLHCWEYIIIQTKLNLHPSMYECIMTVSLTVTAWKQKLAGAQTLAGVQSKLAIIGE